MSNKVEQIKAWAYENYARSYGASCIIECHTDADIDRKFVSLRDAKRYARLMDEMYSNAQE